MTEKEFLEWRHLQATKDFFRLLSAMRHQILDQWAAGMFSSENADATCQMNAEAIGKAYMLDAIQDLEFENFERFKI